MAEFCIKISMKGGKTECFGSNDARIQKELDVYFQEKLKVQHYKTAFPTAFQMEMLFNYVKAYGFLTSGMRDVDLLKTGTIESYDFGTMDGKLYSAGSFGNIIAFTSTA